MSLISVSTNQMTAPSLQWIPETPILPFPLFKASLQTTPPLLSSRKFTPLKEILHKGSLDLDVVFKKESYFSRLFSSETWDEWTENRTALGQFLSLYRDYCENPSKQLIKRMKPLLLQANREAKKLLKNSCALSLAGGIAGSAATQNLLPLILGASNCWTQAAAMPIARQSQQIITVAHAIPNYVTGLVSDVNYQFSEDTFLHSEGKPLNYNASLTDGSDLPNGLEFNSTSRKFSGSVHTLTTNIRVNAFDSEDNLAFSDFRIKQNPDLAYIIMGSILFLGVCTSIIGYKYKLCDRKEGERSFDLSLLATHAPEGNF